MLPFLLFFAANPYQGFGEVYQGTGADRHSYQQSILL
jgi:hypothetical protein